jgi:hypothetical protein
MLPPADWLPPWRLLTPRLARASLLARLGSATRRSGLGFVNKQHLQTDTWPNDIVPFAVEGVRREIDGGDFLVRYLPADRIPAPVEAARDIEPFGRGGRRDQPNDRLVVAQGFATPVREEKGKQAMLDLVDGELPIVPEKTAERSVVAGFS